ncbi:hypothetical protein [Paenibacillus contaminans]|uniref:Uncharacterized protein n=1 Tax=Paenibacillus contaminans TaxID=450362 RepID=A0A329MPH7_9BACL|nr:hypothetical protein [Paenibacillus contaminans]RAV21785.1 hypothetical protein DQG23_06925 [Paenibacillus contaminans]
MKGKAKHKGIYAAGIGAVAFFAMYTVFIGSAVQACACEGEESTGSWMQNLASWGFAVFLIGIFALSMILFTIVMLRNSKRKG